METIALFRFHKEPAICKNHLEIFRKFNPKTKIYGLYGGKKEDIDNFKCLEEYFKNIYVIPVDDPKWKWLHSDLAIRLWYRDVGKDIDFDSLAVIEWDMLVLDALENIYSHIPKETVGLTMPNLIKEVEDKWYWTSTEPHKSEWQELLKIAKEKYDYREEPYGCIAGGLYLPKQFLESFSKIDPPELTHDELRLPLFCQILGFKFMNTNLRTKWFNESEAKYFNANNEDIKISDIKSEFDKDNGRRIFHPIRKIINLEEL